MMKEDLRRKGGIRNARRSITLPPEKGIMGATEFWCRCPLLRRRTRGQFRGKGRWRSASSAGAPSGPFSKLNSLGLEFAGDLSFRTTYAEATSPTTGSVDTSSIAPLLRARVTVDARLFGV